MTDLKRLRVSLTKHGAHKVARLLKQFSLEDVLKNTWGTLKGININNAQARKTLSAQSDGTLPDVWAIAQQLGKEKIDHLVFVAIAFSHHQLIDALKRGATGFGTGKLTDQLFPSRKAFTNFKNDIEELGLATSADANQVTFNFNAILRDSLSAPLVAEILRLKLRSAGWDEKINLVDECINLEIHSALAVPPEYFRDWLSTAIHPGGEQQKNSDEQQESERDVVLKFNFKPRKARKMTGFVMRTFLPHEINAALLHNEIQEKLYEILAGIHGQECVGTEIPSGTGGLIDLVLKQETEITFYEIKTSPNLRVCIRDALPQLMEYAFWPPDFARAQRLVIVSPNSPTKDSTIYLNKIRERFRIPIYYQAIDLETGQLLGPT